MITGGLTTSLALTGRPLLIGRSTGIDSTLHLPFNYVSDVRDLANASGLGGVYGVPEFLWVAGDGNIPTKGPALTLGGVVEVGATPWALADGSNVPSEIYSGADHRYTATVAGDPGVNDFVIFAIIKGGPGGAAVSTFFSNWDGGTVGWLLYQDASGSILGYLRGGIASPQSLTVLGDCLKGYTIVQLVCNRDGNSMLLQNGIEGTPVATAAGSFDQGAGLGIGAYTNGTNKFTGEIVAAGMWMGVAIADNWDAGSYALAKQFAARMSGIHPLLGTHRAFARSSLASAVSGIAGDVNRRHSLYGHGLARAGDGGGLRTAPARTNKCYNTINPQATTGWSITGGGSTPATLAVAADAAGLATVLDPSGDTVDAADWGPNILKLNNFAGDAAAYAYGGAVTANTNLHSSQVIAAEIIGTGIEMGVRDVSGGGFTSHAALHSGGSYGHVVVDGWTPGDTDEQFAIHAPAGTMVYFVAPQLEEGAVHTSLIPNFATAAAAARPQEILDTSYTPADAEGEIDLDITPLGWSGAEPGADATILTRAGGADDLLHAEVAGIGGWATGDGTTQATEIVTPPVNLTEQSVKVGWGARQFVDNGNYVDTHYDNARASSGVLRVAPTIAEVSLKNLKGFPAIIGLKSNSFFNKTCLEFGVYGVNTHVNLGNVLDKERTDLFSVSMWHKNSGPAITSTLGAKTLAGRGWIIQFYHNLAIYFRMNGASTVLSSYTLITDNNLWHNYIITYAGNSKVSGVRFYVDGFLSATGSIADTLSESISNAGDATIAAGSSPVIGRGKDYSFWNKVLTQADVDVINAAGPSNLLLHPAKNDLAAWLRLGDGPGDTFTEIVDQSGNGYHGTMTWMDPTTFVEDSP